MNECIEILQDILSRLEDFLLVCLNCHPILHRQRPCLSIEQMRNNN